MRKFKAISLTLKCGKCDNETNVILPIVISEEDWIKTQENLKRLNEGEDPYKIYLERVTITKLFH